MCVAQQLCCPRGLPFKRNELMVICSDCALYSACCTIKKSHIIYRLGLPELQRVVHFILFAHKWVFTILRWLLFSQFETCAHSLFGDSGTSYSFVVLYLLVWFIKVWLVEALPCIVSIHRLMARVNFFGELQELKNRKLNTNINFFALIVYIFPFRSLKCLRCYWQAMRTNTSPRRQSLWDANNQETYFQPRRHIKKRKIKRMQ